MEQGLVCGGRMIITTVTVFIYHAGSFIENISIIENQRIYGGIRW